MYAGKRGGDLFSPCHSPLLLLLLTLCSSQADVFQKPEDLFDPADTSSAIDLAEVPLWLDLLRSAGLVVQDAGFKKRFTDDFQDLQGEIEKSLIDPGLGCLLKVKMFVGPTGAIAIPGGQLIEPAGVGNTPIDALANLRATPYIGAQEWFEPPFEDQSYYIWIKREQGKLKAGIIPREGREALQKYAQEESHRRRVINNVDQAVKSADVETLARDKYWSDLAQKNRATLRDNAQRQRVQELVQDFATAQRRFNEAYEQYLQKKEELREEQQNASTLQTISRIAGVVSSAVQLGQVASANNSDAKVTAPSNGQSDAPKIMMEYHEKRIDSLNGSVRELENTIEIRGATVRQLDENLTKAFQDNGVKISDPDQKLVLPPKR
jgi:hypothetical protein